MREPWFWTSDARAARAITTLLAPAAFLYNQGHRLRWKMATPHKAGVPVICVGNATLGGVGKTPFAIMIARLLRDRGVNPFFLTRGHGGYERGPVLAEETHRAFDVGDEALVLRTHAPVVVSRNRRAGAALAEKSGAEVIIMDDGFQNPTLQKDLSVLLVGAEGADNGKCFPAGPWREPLEEAKRRADIVVAVGADEAAAKTMDADYYAWTEPLNPEPQRVYAFAGIGRPEKFFASLRSAGYDVAGAAGFPDHHVFTPVEVRALAREAKKAGARLIATEKDLMRLDPELREDVLTLRIEMRVDDEAGLRGRLLKIFDNQNLSLIPAKAGMSGMKA